MRNEFIKRPLDRRDAMKLVRLNAAGVTLCVAVSLVFNAGIFWGSAPQAFARGMISAIALPLILGVPLFLYLSMQIRSLWTLNGQLVDSATRDSLTRLLNRGAFIGQVGAALDEMARLDAARGALLVIDADCFKLINDRWGHAKGDDALCRISDAIGRLMRDDDIAGRLGGEEFGVFLYGSSPSGAQAAAERLRRAVEAIDLRSDDNQRIPLTISIGGVHFRQALPFNMLYQSADLKLYQAKANGRNRVEFEALGGDALISVAA